MERLQDKRVWLGGGAVAALLIVAIGWFMFIGPELSSTSDLHAQAAATRQQNSQLQLRVKSLQVKSTQLDRYTKSLNDALAALPFDSGLPAFTRQLSSQAAANHVAVTSVAVGGITSVAPAVATAPGTTDPASATDPTSTATTAPTPGAAGTTAAGGLFSVQVTVQSSGSLAHQLAFLNDIRTAGPRRALLTSTQFTPGLGSKVASIDGSAALTTQLTIFSAPQTPEQIAQLKKLLSGKIGN